MTNLQEGAKRLPPSLLRQLWLWLPAATGGLLAALVVTGGLVPIWLGLQRDSQRLQDLQQFRDQVTLLRSQLGSLDQKERQGMAQKERLYELITGARDLSTFMAAIGREAALSGVQVDLYEPQAAAAPAPAAPPGRPAAAPPRPAAPAGQPAAPAGQPAAPAGGLELAGLQHNAVLLTARGDFPAQLAFLRRLEALNLLVLQSDLNLSLGTAPPAAKGQVAPPPPVVLKLVLSFYDRPGQAAPPAGTPPAAPGAPAANPPAVTPPAAKTPAPAAAPPAPVPTR